MLTAMPSGLVEEISRGRVGGGNLFTSQCRQACPRPVIPGPVPSFLRRQESIPVLSGLPPSRHSCKGRNPSPSEQSFVDAA